jgi:hypothetical protein
VFAASLVVAAAVGFSLGMWAVGRQEDRLAIYWLAVGALCLKASTDLVRPRSAP